MRRGRSGVYATAADLAADIRRGGFSTECRSFARRALLLQSFEVRPPKLERGLEGTLAAASLLLGFGVSIWQAEVARAERDRAEQRFQDVRKLSNSLLFEITPKIERPLEARPRPRSWSSVLLSISTALLRKLRAIANFKKELAAAYEKIGELQAIRASQIWATLPVHFLSYEKANAIRPAQPGNAGKPSPSCRELSSFIRCPLLAGRYTRDAVWRF
ncbi:MAG: hypothetical protein IPM21_12030 [Acidobacteria bacterium]|nr:hypothetical protein [Acidobacteriota bacterium]